VVLTKPRRERSKRASLRVWAFSIAASLWPAIALAQPSVEDAAIARRLFEQGVQCGDGGDWACAAERFGQAYALRPSPVIALNWAQALARVGRVVESSELLARVARDATAPEDLRERARVERAEIEPRISTIRVSITGARREVAFELDGRPFPAALISTAVPVDPGEHVVHAFDGASRIAEARATLEPGAREEITLAIPEPAVDDPEPVEVVVEPTREIAEAIAPREAESEDGASGWWIALGVGGGVAVIAAATVLVFVLMGADAAQAPFEGSLGLVEVR
jgi:hypothetical protein